MRIVFFVHSLLSDWNHGNAHFLRGVAAELIARGHDVEVFEPRDAWSLQNLLADRGRMPLDGFHARLPRRSPATRYDLATLDLDRALDGADLVIVHEWNDHGLVRRIGEHRRTAQATGCSSTTPTTARSPRRRAWPPTTSRTTTACSPSASVIRDLYLDRGWAERAWTWHEAADTRVFHPMPGRAEGGGPRLGRQLGRRRAHGRAPRVPARAGARPEAQGPGPRRPLPRGRAAGPRRGGDRVRRLARQPRGAARLRPLPGDRPRPAPAVRRGAPRHPDHPPLRGPRLRHPAGLRALERRRGALHAPASDFLVARDGGGDAAAPARPARTIRRCAAELARSGRETVLARHTCAHRVDELLAIGRELGAAMTIYPWSVADRMNIAFFGSSLVSAYWNGAATYYRGIIRALAERGHRVTFYEPDAYERQQHRDIPDPEWATRRRLPRPTRAAVDARAGSGPGRRPDRQGERRRRLRRAAGGRRARPAGGRTTSSSSGTSTPPPPSTAWRATRPTPSAPLVPRYDLVLTYGGGDPVVQAYRAFRRPRVRADLQRPRSRDPPPRGSRPAVRGRPGLPRQPPARPRGARRGVLPARRRARAPSAASCSAAAAGATSRCRPT